MKYPQRMFEGPLSHGERDRVRGDSLCSFRPVRPVYEYLSRLRISTSSDASVASLSSTATSSKPKRS